MHEDASELMLRIRDLLEVTIRLMCLERLGRPIRSGILVSCELTLPCVRLNMCMVSGENRTICRL